MNLLADESIDRQIVERLRQDGHNVIYIAEIDPSIPDGQVFDWANESESLLITGDKDFGEIVFRDRRLISDGVVLIRLSGLSREKKSKVVSEAIKGNVSGFRHKFSVIAPGKIRIRTRDEV